MNRRRAAQLLVAAPVAVVAARAQERSKPSGAASCLAAMETGLTAAERARLRKAIGGLESSLEVIRDFAVPADADPAMHFRPIRLKRRG
jgi:hypothetical protein